MRGHTPPPGSGINQQSKVNCKTADIRFGFQPFYFCSDSSVHQPMCRRRHRLRLCSRAPKSLLQAVGNLHSQAATCCLQLSQLMMRSACKARRSPAQVSEPVTPCVANPCCGGSCLSPVQLALSPAPLTLVVRLQHPCKSFSCALATRRKQLGQTAAACWDVRKCATT